MDGLAPDIYGTKESARRDEVHGSFPCPDSKAHTVCDGKSQLENISSIVRVKSCAGPKDVG